MSCNIVINQQSPLPASDRSAPEAKVKDPERQRRGKKITQNVHEKTKGKVFKGQSRTADDPKRIYGLFSTGPE